MKTVRVALTLLFLSLCSTSLWAALKAEPSAIDLGRRQQEQVVAVDVKLANNGDAPLEILAVTADCSCTAASPAKRALAPGESTDLQIKVETRGYIGRLRRNIQVQSSAGDVTIPIDLNITLFKNWSIEPATIVMRPSQKGQAGEAQVQLRYLGEGRREIGAITTVPDWLQAGATTEDGTVFQLKFVKPAEAPAGNYSVKVAVPTNDATDPVISFNVFVPITSALRISPNPIILPTVKAGQSSTREITIQGWSAAAAPRFELGNGRMTITHREGNKLTCEIVVVPQYPGPFTQLLRIHDGEKLEAEVPVIVRAEPGEETKK